VRVAGAPDAAMARDSGARVAGSNLVKAAIFGADPNWGRVLIGHRRRAPARALGSIPTRSRTVHVQGVCVYDGGAPGGVDPLALRAKMREPHVTIDVQLVEGEASAGWGCDLSYDYVKINADYTSLTHASPTAPSRATTGSPTTAPASSARSSSRRSATSRVHQQARRREVRRRRHGEGLAQGELRERHQPPAERGAAAHRRARRGPEITHTLEKLGTARASSSTACASPGRDDVKVVEMVLTGKINTELVSLLNQSSAHAVGVSGKDAGLLRARKLIGEGGRDLGMVGEVTQVNHELLEVLLDRKYVPGRLAGGPRARTARATTSTPTRPRPRSRSRSKRRSSST
jgi:acetylglutamate kinase